MSEHNIDTEFKPCPGCGTVPTDMPWGAGWFVYCPLHSCNLGWWVKAGDKRKAIDVWNKRVSEWASSVDVDE